MQEIGLLQKVHNNVGATFGRPRGRTSVMRKHCGEYVLLWRASNARPYIFLYPAFLCIFNQDMHFSVYTGMAMNTLG